MRKILAADLWPPGRNDQPFKDAGATAIADGKVRLKQLIENVLLYDQVVVPTDNLLSLHVLAKVFGPESIATLIDEGILRFQRFNGQLVYAGAGRGLTAIKVNVSESVKNGRPVGPAWLPTGIAATAILEQMHGVEPRRAKQIAAKVISVTKEIDLDTILRPLRDRTFEAAHSPAIETLAIDKDNLDDLGIRADQLRLVGEWNEAWMDDIQKLLAIARTQHELFAKEQSGCDDMSTLSPVGKIIAPNANAKTSLHHLYEITDVPDVGAATMHGAVTIDQVLKFRNTRNWEQFAKWFHETCSSDPNSVGREYVKLLRSEAPLDTNFFKTVRLLVSTAIGVISPIGGIIAAAADTFLLPKIKEASAKYFVDDLEQLALSQVNKNDDG